MFYLDFLRGLHERLAPRTYLEIGVAQGHSLALSRCRSVGIDPAFAVDQELLAPTSLLRRTSDAYFAGLERAGERPFDRLPIDLAYIDGMHHFEYAVRDFISIERYSHAPAWSRSTTSFPATSRRPPREASRRGPAMSSGSSPPFQPIVPTWQTPGRYDAHRHSARDAARPIQPRACKRASTTSSAITCRPIRSPSRARSWRGRTQSQARTRSP